MIEALIAVSLLVIAMVPITSVMWSGLKAGASSSHRTEAFSLAAGQIESLHADPYDRVGFYTDQAPPAWRGDPTVIVGPCSTTCPAPFAPLVLPVGTSAVGGVTYAIARYVYWSNSEGPLGDDAMGTYLEAEKATTVTVSWSDDTGRHQVEQDSIIYPGGLGVYTGPGGSTSPDPSTTVVSAAPGQPAIALLPSQPAWPQSEHEIDVAVVAPTGGGAVGQYFVQWATDPAFAAPSQSPPLPPSSTFYAAEGLAATTTYYLRVFAANGAGQSPYSSPAVTETTASVSPPTTTTLAAGPTTTVAGTTTTVPAPTTTTTTTTTTIVAPTTTLACDLGAFTVTTAVTGKTYLQQGNGKMSEDVVLSVSVTGACPLSLTVSSSLHGTTTADPGSPYQLTGPINGGQWTYTIPANGQKGWSVGTHDLSVSVGGTLAAITHGLLVCQATPDPSPLPTAC